jgi:hypothetical protein
VHATFSERTAVARPEELTMVADEVARAVSADPTPTIAARTTQPVSPYCWVMLNRRKGVIERNMARSSSGSDAAIGGAGCNSARMFATQQAVGVDRFNSEQRGAAAAFDFS